MTNNANTIAARILRNSAAGRAPHMTYAAAAKLTGAPAADLLAELGAEFRTDGRRIYLRS